MIAQRPATIANPPGTRRWCGTKPQPVNDKWCDTGFQPVSLPSHHPQSLIQTLALLLTTLALTGCASTGTRASRFDRVELKQRSIRCLQQAIQFDQNPAVRLEAVEAFQYVPRDDALPWIRTALDDKHPAVRFAACVALGQMNDGLSLRRIEARVDDENASVQVAALFALHRLGNRERSGELPTFLLRHDDAAVRRNAALLLGMLDDKSAIKIMARAMSDSDEGVRHHALEAMARLGNVEARRELALMTRSGVGSEEVFAITALAGAKDPRSIDTFRYKLHNAAHLETRLAAARALGEMGKQDGLETAMHALTGRRKLVNDPNDPPEQQILRARQMAAAAIGAIGSDKALPQLVPLLDDSVDLRLQVSAAAATLQILSRTSTVGATLPARATSKDD